MTTINCRNCNHRYEISSTKSWEEFVCSKCFHFSIGSQNTSQQLNFPKSNKFCFELYKKYEIDTKTYQLISIAIKRVNKLYSWTEYSFSNQENLIFFSECNGHWIKMSEIELNKRPNVFLKHKSNSLKTEINFNGRPYDIYSKDNVEVIYFEGVSFNKDSLKKYELGEYISPPYIVSSEFKNHDYTSYHGVHIDKRYLQSIKPDIVLPPKFGIGIVEPSSFDFYHNLMVFVYCAFFIIFTAVVLSFTRSDVKAFSLLLEGGDTSREVRSKSFTLNGPAAPLSFTLESGVDNSWASADIELVNETTGESIYASKDVEFYHGYEDGESWSEGSRREKFNICGVGSGKYHVVLSTPKSEPDIVSSINQRLSSDTANLDSVVAVQEAIIAQNLALVAPQEPAIARPDIRLEANWSEPSFWNMFMGLLGLAIVGIIYFLYSQNHDKNRWSDSDYDIYYEEY